MCHSAKTAVKGLLVEALFVFSHPIPATRYSVVAAGLVPPRSPDHSPPTEKCSVNLHKNLHPFFPAHLMHVHLTADRQRQQQKVHGGLRDRCAHRTATSQSLAGQKNTCRPRYLRQATFFAIDRDATVCVVLRVYPCFAQVRYSRRRAHSPYVQLPSIFILQQRK